MITINSSNLILESERFSVERLEYRLESSEIYKKDVVRHPGAVVILPIDSEGNLVFVRQPRVAIKKDLLELPAGTRAKGEDPLVCARRELAEEVGLAASEWQSLGEIYPAPGFCDETLYLFVAKGLSDFKLPHDKEERITIQIYQKQRVLDIIADGTLQDAKSLALLYRAQIKGLW